MIFCFMLELIVLLRIFTRRRASPLYPPTRSRLSGLLFPCRIDLFLPHPGGMFLRLRPFPSQGLEQIVGVGLPPGHAYEPCVQLAEGFFGLPGLLFAGDARLDTVFVEQLPVDIRAIDLFPGSVLTILRSATRHRVSRCRFAAGEFPDRSPASSSASRTMRFSAFQIRSRSC